MSALPTKRTFYRSRGMSAMCQKRTHCKNDIVLIRCSDMGQPLSRDGVKGGNNHRIVGNNMAARRGDDCSGVGREPVQQRRGKQQGRRGGGRCLGWGGGAGPTAPPTDRE